MVTRDQPSVKVSSLPRNVREARKALSLKGWSYQSAADHLGRSKGHLTEVLMGRRESRRLLEEILALPFRTSPKRLKPGRKIAA